MDAVGGWVRACWGCARGLSCVWLWRHDCSSADGVPLLWGHKRWEPLWSVLSVSSPLYIVSPPAHRKATSFALTLNEQPSHPSHPKGLRTKQTNTLTGRDAWGRWDICECFARYTCALCCHMYLWLYSSYSNLFFVLCACIWVVAPRRCCVDRIILESVKLVSDNGFKSCIIHCCTCSFQMQVIIACFGGLWCIISVYERQNCIRRYL